MAKKPTTLKFTRTIKAPVAHIYYAFTNRSGWKEWFSEGAEGDAKKHKQIFLAWKMGPSASLKFTALKENEQITFNLFDSETLNPTEVNVTLNEQGENTEIEVEHRGVSAAQVDWFTKLWVDGLENLQSVFEEGRDRRIYNKPMMGVLVGDMVTPEVAEKKKLPLGYGMLLADVLKGMGAQAAGLTAGDLVIEIAGVKVEDFTAIEKVISPRSSGDVVEMVYYRGKEKSVAQVELSLRPMPVMPVTTQDLSEKVGDVYSSANAKLDEVFEDVKEEQAEYRLKRGEWNSKEVLAHMISTERDFYGWAGSFAHGHEAYTWTANLPARLKSIRAIYPRVSDLRNELERNQQEGVVFLTELPSEFVGRKPSFARMVTMFLLELPEHYQEHIGQIQDNLAAIQGVG